MRAWDKAFRRASFRGARFWVDSEDPSGGRRVAVHELPAGERPITQDIGGRVGEFSVSAYVASDSADAEGRILEAACKAFGEAMLVLPMDPAQMAHCTSWRRNRTKDRNGYIAYSLSFVEAGSQLGGGLSLGIGGISVSAGLGGISVSGGIAGIGGVSLSAGLGGVSLSGGISGAPGFMALSSVRNVFSSGVGPAASAISSLFR